MNELTITNYDNFKDLSFFVNEHEKAIKILENVNNFYLSFLKSKLFYCRDIDKYPGNLIKCEQRKEIYLSFYPYKDPSKLRNNEHDYKLIRSDKHCYVGIYNLLNAAWHNNKLDNINEHVTIRLGDSFNYCKKELTGTIVSSAYDTWNGCKDLTRYYFKFVLDEPINYYDLKIGYNNPFNTRSMAYNYIYRLKDKYKLCEQEVLELLYNDINLQNKFKEEISKSLTNRNHDYWIYYNQYKDDLIEFDTNKNLSKYQFKIVYNLSPEKIKEDHWSFKPIDITKFDQSQLHKYLMVYKIDPYTVEEWSKEVRKSKTVMVGGDPYGGFVFPKLVKKYKLTIFIFDIENGNYFMDDTVNDGAKIISNFNLSNI